MGQERVMVTGGTGAAPSARGRARARRCLPEVKELRPGRPEPAAPSSERRAKEVLGWKQQLSLR